MTVLAVTNPSRCESFCESCKKDGKEVLELLNKIFNAKPLKSLTDLIKNGFKFTAEFSELNDASRHGLKTAETVSSFVGVLGLLGTTVYFANYGDKLKKAETTQQQAAGMALVGVAGIWGTLKWLEEYKLKTLNKITATIGKIPVIQTVIPGLSIGIGGLMLAHEWVTWKRQAIDDKINKVYTEIWAEKEKALKELEEAVEKNPTLVTHRWEDLRKAGQIDKANNNRDRVAELKRLVEEQKTLYTEKQWKFRAESNKQDDPWTKIFQCAFTDDIVLVNPKEENATEKTNPMIINNKCKALREGIEYEQDRCKIARKDTDLYKTRAYIRIVQSIIEIAAGALILIGLFAGVGFLAAGPLGIALSLVVASIALYQVFDSNRPPKHKPKVIPDAWDHLARWNIQGVNSQPQAEVPVETFEARLWRQQTVGAINYADAAASTMVVHNK